MSDPDFRSHFAVHGFVRLNRAFPAAFAITVRVVELTGQPGDLVFIHPHLFHAPAPNRGPSPRLMVTGGLAR